MGACMQPLCKHMPCRCVLLLTGLCCCCAFVCDCVMFMVQQSEIRWASRWDTYLQMTDDQIHWFSIVNSVMIVLFLSGMVAMIMVRTLYR